MISLLSEFLLIFRHESDRIIEGANDWNHILDGLHKPEDELHLDHEADFEKELFDEYGVTEASKNHFFKSQSGSIRDLKRKPKIMNRIPDDAEASIVLVGKMNFLKEIGQN